MKAAVLTRYGSSGAIELLEVDEPPLRPGCLRVEVAAAGLNPIDFKTRDGRVRLVSKHRLPLVLGNELAGRVTEVAPDVTDFAPGDEIFARVDARRAGAFAEVAVVDSAHAAHKPASLSPVEAAGVPLAALTARQSLDAAGVTSGTRVLIHAGAGGVGAFAIQLARLRGAHIATTCSARNCELVTALGADRAIDYTTEQFDQLLSDYDAVLDTVGGATLKRSFRVLRPGGRMVSLSGTPEPGTAVRNQWGTGLRIALWFASFGLRRRARRHRVTYQYLMMKPSGAQLAEIAQAIDAGAVRVTLDRSLPFGELREALAYLETGHARGKVVVEMRPQQPQSKLGNGS